MLTPRENFRKTDLAKRWLDVVDGTQFQVAASTALMEMAIQNGAPPDMATAASYQWRMEGAKQFLRILMGLTLEKPPPKTPIPENLNHRV